VASLGLLKETLDGYQLLPGSGIFDFNDITADMVGIALGSVLILSSIRSNTS